MRFRILEDRFAHLNKFVILKECDRSAVGWNNHFWEIRAKNEFITVLEFFEAIERIIFISNCLDDVPDGYNVFRFAGTWCVKISFFDFNEDDMSN